MITLEEMKPVLLEEMGKEICQCTKEAWGTFKNLGLRTSQKPHKGWIKNHKLMPKAQKGEEGAQQ
jgi:hypothetical protein